MKKYFCLLLLFASFIIHIKAQNVVGINNVEKTSLENEYLISTQITGLIDVDIARVIYNIEDEHTCKKTSSTSFLLSQKNNQVKFYVIAVPKNGEISISFHITLSEKKDFTFPIRIEYSKDEEKKIVTLPSISITDNLIASNKTKTNSDSETEANKQKEIEKIANEEVEKEKLLAEQKAKEEELAKQKEAERKAKEQAENEKLLAEQKAKEEELAKQKEAERRAKEQAENEKLLAEQKAKEEELAKQKEAERRAKEQAENEKLLAEQKTKEEELKRIAEEKAKKEAEDKLLAEQKAAEEKAKKETSISDKKSYTVQLLSLSKFSEAKLNYYLKQHSLSKSDIIIREVNGVTKISYKKTTSKQEAVTYQTELANNHGISQSFIVLIP